uniref:(northern house mosquito) hypothetical protein n=1 Tax=Culex pipiens TaxID=7175 RepID=A0A8D8PAB9_CULPI
MDRVGSGAAVGGADLWWFPKNPTTCCGTQIPVPSGQHGQRRYGRRRPGSPGFVRRPEGYHKAAAHQQGVRVQQCGQRVLHVRIHAVLSVPVKVHRNPVPLDTIASQHGYRLYIAGVLRPRIASCWSRYPANQAQLAAACRLEHCNQHSDILWHRVLRLFRM